MCYVTNGESCCNLQVFVLWTQSSGTKSFQTMVSKMREEFKDLGLSFSIGRDGSSCQAWRKDMSDEVENTSLQMI